MTGSNHDKAEGDPEIIHQPRRFLLQDPSSNTSPPTSAGAGEGPRQHRNFSRSWRPSTVPLDNRGRLFPDDATRDETHRHIHTNLDTTPDTIDADPQQRSMEDSNNTASSSDPAGNGSRRRHLEHDDAPKGDGRSSRLFSATGKRPGVNSSGDESNIRLDNYRAWVTRQRKRAKGPRVRFEEAFNEYYQKWIIEGLLRQKPLPPSSDGRHIPLSPGTVRRSPLTDERSGKHYISNYIRSSRYTLWSFLPKQLYFQFSKLANFYFLVIGILQMIPGLSTIGTYTTIAPLAVFVAISMAKEGYDDYRRYMMDKTENKAPAWVLDPEGTIQESSKRARLAAIAKKKHTRKHENPGGEMDMTELQDIGQNGEESPRYSKVQWQRLRVGDIIRLRRDDNVPADIVLLHATGLNGIAYIETMALDGETNLKSKQACPLLANRCDTMAKMKHSGAVVVSEDPNSDLYNFEGRVSLDDETMPLTLNEVVFRGSTLRNTDEAFGLVINTGEECKIRMNANKEVHTKAPKIQILLNRIVILLVFCVLILTFGCTGGYYLWRDEYERFAPYLRGAEVPFTEIWFGFLIAFNTLIPLSLYVSLEIIKVGQFLMLNDIEMYDAETDTPMIVNTTTILENLGQVSYVFSDKTGTLTENKMRFRKLSVAGAAWLHDVDVARDEQEKQARDRELRGDGQRHLGGTSGNVSRVETEAINAPLIDNRRPIKTLSRSSSTWTSTARPAHPQPEMKTEDLLKYMRQKPNTTFSRKARQFLLCVALCHTCLPETKENGEIVFQAASPDELALVQAAKDLGYLLIDRPAQSIKLQLKNLEGELVTETYQVLDVIEFSSKRKRMSIVIRMPDGRICVFCKGADNVILARLKMADLAQKKASDVERRATQRRSMEAERARHRGSYTPEPRNSLVMRESYFRKDSARRSKEFHRQSRDLHRQSVSNDLDTWLSRRETQDFEDATAAEDVYNTPRHSLALSPSLVAGGEGFYDGMVDESLAANDGAIFERCFQHIGEFATEGLRTLLYAFRYISDDEYSSWKTVYQAATTSLVDRQQRIEEAAESVERDFDLAGATAIEDKLQDGVPETIDKLRRANIKVWMLTGDKRETAIEIAHSARLAKPFSEIYILDVTVQDLQEKITSTLVDIGRGMIAHSVLVVDGQTLGAIEEDESLSIMFFDLVVRMDAVICCRASPSQKASLVKSIRDTVPSSLTLAIGDGANDIAMIQASHVGIGISGREGLQAARVADYSIAQFRFLQRLLLVHGRWMYLRTSNYILATFWKEIVFYIIQAQYQHWNGYTGTSIYESWSLTVFNVLFTSLPVILLGIFEQDLRPDTLLAVPELYTYGQRSQGFNFKKYIWWTFMGALDTVIIYMLCWGHYKDILFTEDNSLFPFGQMVFTVCVVIINVKILILELHHKTWITFLGFFLSILAWFVWNLFIGGIYAAKIGPYNVRNALVREFGNKLGWWTTIGATLAAVVAVELGFTALRRIYFPKDQDLWQEIERQGGVGGVLKEHAAEEGRAATPDDNVRKVIDEEFEPSHSAGPSVDSFAGAPINLYIPPSVAQRRNQRLRNSTDMNGQGSGRGTPIQPY